MPTLLVMLIFYLYHSSSFTFCDWLNWLEASICLLTNANSKPSSTV